MQKQQTRIGLNAHLLSLSQSYRGAGISWYIVNLLKNLQHISPDHFEYDAFLSDRTFQAQQANLRLHYSRLPTRRPVLRIFWEQCIQPFALRRANIDLLHALAFVAPVSVPCPFVITVYDLSFIRYPDAFRPFNRWYLRHFTGYSARRAKAIITISESTRRDVIKLLKAPPERVHTVYCGVDDTFRPLPGAEIAAFKSAQRLPEKFILFLGTLEPRKNIDGLINAYAHWRRQQPEAPPLVLAGGKGWYYQRIFQLVESLGLTQAIHFPGYIPQQLLPLWYNAASLFVYPSHFEGFGLPVLEAMACGTPVITSTAASLPEVAGRDGAARLVDPTDIQGLAAALADVAGRPELQAAMRHQGLARAARFNWQTTAQETVEIYRKVIAR